jgi:hypothetical protein
MTRDADYLFNDRHCRCFSNMSGRVVKMWKIALAADELARSASSSSPSWLLLPVLLLPMLLGVVDPTGNGTTATPSSPIVTVVARAQARPRRLAEAEEAAAADRPSFAIALHQRPLFWNESTSQSAARLPEAIEHDAGRDCVPENS